jgi:hypothetical protein
MTDSANARTSNPASSNAFAASVLVRPSRDEDVDAMLDIYRRHIMRGVEPAFATPTRCSFANARPIATP